MDFHPKSRILVTGGEDSIVRVWDLKDKKVAMTWKAHQTSVVSVRCSPDEDHVASASVDGILYIHNLRNGKTVTKLQQRGDESKDALKMIEYSPFERSRIAVCTDTGKVQVWESSRAKLLTSIAAHVAPCSAIAFSQVNAALLISAGLDKTVKLHDIRARKTVSTLTLDSPATAVDIAPDGTTLAVGTASGNVYIYDLQKAMKPIQTLMTSSTNAGTEIECLTFQRAAHFGSSSSSASGASNSTLKTPRAPTSTVSLTQTDNYFAPSPQVVVVPATHSGSELDAITSSASSVDAGSRSSLGGAPTQPMDLFSPLKSFEPQATSTPNAHLTRSGSALDASPFTPLHSSSSVKLSLDVLSPLQTSSSFSADDTATGTSSSDGGLAPSGTPLSLLSPAPPTPSSYRYSSRLSSTLFSPLAPIPGTVTTEETAYMPTSPGRSLSSDALTSADSPLTSSMSSLNMSPLALSGHAGSSTPRKTSSIDFNLGSPLASVLQSPVHGASTSSLGYASPLQSSHLSPRLDRLNRGSPPSSPSAHRSAPSARADATDATHEGIQWQLMQSVLGNMMDGFRAEVQDQLHSMHLEMIRQFHIQQAEISALLQEHKTNKELIDIIKELKAENEQLRKLY